MWALFVLFLVLEVGVYGIVTIMRRKHFGRKEWGLLLISIGFLSVLPIFRYGYWNDLVMRASIPGLFVLSIFIARIPYYRWLSKSIRIMIVSVLLLGSITPFLEFRRHITGVYRRGKLFVLPERPTSLSDAERPADNLFFVAQYVGGVGSPFFDILAKPVQCTSLEISGHSGRDADISLCR